MSELKNAAQHPRVGRRQQGSAGSAAQGVTRAKGRAGRAVTLGVFALAMIEVNAVLAVRNLPSMAELGWHSVGWYVLGLLLFFLPLSLIGAELATGWPKGGGVYAWVREAFGEKSGFIAIWSDWIENLVWFPTVLAFISSTLAFALFPSAADNRWLMVAIMLGVFWAVTLANFFGDRLSSLISSIGATVGVILPTGLLILLLLVYVLEGKHSALPFTASGMLPDLNAGTLPFVATIVLLFAGMEMAGFHALETRNPSRDYPKAILLSGVIIFVFSVLGTIAIAVTVSTKDLSLAAGVIQATSAMFDSVGVPWLTIPIAIMLVIGVVAQLSTYLVGPAKAIGVAAAQGNLPPVWREHNSFGSPVAVLLIQAGISSVFALLFVLIPSVNTVYWILTALTTQGLIVMYVLMFAAAIKLRYSQPKTPRPYRIPGGKIGIWIVGGIALLSLGFAFVVGLLPPNTTDTSIWLYLPLMLAASLLFTVGVPFIFWRFKKPDWRAENAEAYLTSDTHPEEVSGNTKPDPS
ncbi:amino acid permease [Salinibacterium sp. SWN139]|uniref:APC family permease n=1 Tax=Salinibacterium sp. SWN139 TaxID=2792055 RepID=UPI0018CC8FB8|nr:APC family permease [Salinibacterium sp. SWN139]MBH0054422.1 amino acid permease [Salinibacterium sp. SWN139]